MIDFAQLNEVQRQATQDTEGSILVFAGAGSGKTRVLTMRIANIIEKGLAMPYEILAITFTNKAANEMKERIATIVGDISSMWVCTIHSMCTRILRNDIDKIGFDKYFSIYTDTEKDRLIKEIIKERGYDEELFKTAKWHISNAKSTNVTIDDYENANSFVNEIQSICDIFRAYEKMLKVSNALDFDDLLTKTYELLKSREDVREKYSSRFKYIHIDEFQDTNNIQYEIVKLLYRNHKNIFAVGDDDQSIYGFRGANVKNILNFERDFPNAKIYKLEQNYRSTKKILEVANTIIKKNITRADKALWCDNDEGVRIEYHSGYNENDESAHVASVIKSLVTVSGYNYNDIAVLYRMNSLSRSFEQEFVKYNVPYKVFGGLKFFERKEIKDLTAYLRAVVNPKDTEAIRRIINVPKRGIGDTTVAKIMKISYDEGRYFYEVLQDLEKYPEFSGATRNKLICFRDVYFSLINDISEYSPVEYINQVLSRTQFKEQFEGKSEENISRLLNIGEFVNSMQEFGELNEGATIVEFLESITLSSAIDDLESGDDAVTLATVHSVKGLEFKVVFIVGLDEKYFPIVRQDTTEADIEEERRLMYVAITRARERLYLTRCDSRYSFYIQSRIHMMRSRFIDDIKDVVGIKDKVVDEFDNKTEKKEFRGRIEIKPMSRPQAPVSSGNVNAKFVCGDKVAHPKFGEGTVIAVKGEADATVCDVAFAGHGVKSLALKYAPLTKI